MFENLGTRASAIGLSPQEVPRHPREAKSKTCLAALKRGSNKNPKCRDYPIERDLLKTDGKTWACLMRKVGQHYISPDLQ